MTVNDRIAKIRTVLNLSQPKFGEKIGVSRDVIANIELGRAEIKDVLFKHICDVYNVNPLWLKDGEGEMFFGVADSLINDLATEFDLNDVEKKIVSNFVNLSKSDREKIIELVKKLIT